MLLLNSCSEDCAENSKTPAAPTEAITPHEKGFSIDFKPISDENYLIGKWVFSEAWMGHMGLALEIKRDHTFEYWFSSDVKLDIEYPINGEWKLADGVLKLSAGDHHLYANHWVLAESNGVEGLMNPNNIAIIMIHDASPESRFIKKLSQSDVDLFDWPMYNYPITIKLDTPPK